MRLSLPLLALLVLLLSISSSGRHVDYRLVPPESEYIELAKKEDSSVDFHEAYLKTLGAGGVDNSKAQQLAVWRAKKGPRYN